MRRSLDPALKQLIAGIVADDERLVASVLVDSPEAATAHAEAGEPYYSGIEHYLYAGDTALHIAAAAYRTVMALKLIDLGADVAARNHRGAQPLHYAADGIPGSHAWNPTAQAATVKALLEAGADPNAVDNSGVAPLHRAVRTRSTPAVTELLEGDADPDRPNRKGSTPLQLATWTTGRGGSGSPEAKAEQQRIIRLLLRFGARQ